MGKRIEDLRTYLVSNIKIDPDSNCWIWQLDTSNHGYGRVKLKDSRPPVHRASYEVFVAPIPDGLVIDHLCRRPSCINPSHLEPVTSAENVRRGAGPGAALYQWPTHCKYGHEMSEGNYFVRKTHSGGTGRQCKTCHARHTSEAKARQAARLAK